MKTKVIALDVYGTFLNTGDAENCLPPRTGFEIFVQKCQSLNLKLVTASDANLPNLMIDLEETFKNSRREPKLTLEIFDGFYRLTTIPKDFSNIISVYALQPQELFVIGDTYNKDIRGAESLGCSTLLVEEYSWNYGHDFDFRSVEIP
jgi:hypothetical protein